MCDIAVMDQSMYRRYRCARDGKHAVLADKIVDNGGYEPITLYVCGQHKRALERGDWLHVKRNGEFRVRGRMSDLGVYEAALKQLKRDVKEQEWLVAHTLSHQVSFAIDSHARDILPLVEGVEGLEYFAKSLRNLIEAKNKHYELEQEMYRTEEEIRAAKEKAA